MKVLWITSQVLPVMSTKLGMKKSNFGGWVTNMLNELKCKENLEIAVVMGLKNIQKVTKETLDGIDYYLVPIKGYAKVVKKTDCEEVIKNFHPDLIHIEGNEYVIQEKFSEFKNVKNIVSLQGILVGYAQYQYGELPIAEMMFCLSPTKWVTAWTLFFRKKLLFKKRLKYEKNILENANNFFGRTEWDKSYAYWYNKKAKYYHCARILRKSFYTEKWYYENCNKHTIFVGNGYSALKGLHNVVEALSILKIEYPDICLTVAGNSPFNKSFKSKIGYSLYLKNKISASGLEKNIIFLGELNELEMVNAMLKANCVVLPSLIENSPNTLAEAMMLGVPTVSAFAGGVTSMGQDEKEILLYRANESLLLATKVKRLFDSEKLCKELSSNSRKRALVNHNKNANVELLINAYSDILN